MPSWYQTREVVARRRRVLLVVGRLEVFSSWPRPRSGRSTSVQPAAAAAFLRSVCLLLRGSSARALRRDRPRCRSSPPPPNDARGERGDARDHASTASTPPNTNCRRLRRAADALLGRPRAPRARARRRSFSSWRLDIPAGEGSGRDGGFGRRRPLPDRSACRNDPPDAAPERRRVAVPRARRPSTFEDLRAPARRAAGRRRPTRRRPPSATAAASRHDPGGSWVAEDEARARRPARWRSCARASGASRCWSCDPDHQSAGVGRELLARAHDYADGARGRIILSSPDPRAMRAYARLGLTLHPCLTGHGRAARRRRARRACARAAPSDIPFTEAVDRHVRGAAHGADIETLLEMGSTLLVAPGARLRMVGADGERAAAGRLRRGRRARAAARPRWPALEGRGRASSCITRAPAVGDRRLPRGRARAARRTPGAVFLGGDVGAVHARTCRAAPSCDASTH